MFRRYRPPLHLPSHEWPERTAPAFDCFGAQLVGLQCVDRPFDVIQRRLQQQRPAARSQMVCQAVDDPVEHRSSVESAVPGPSSTETGKASVFGGDVGRVGDDQIEAAPFDGGVQVTTVDLDLHAVPPRIQARGRSRQSTDVGGGRVGTGVCRGHGDHPRTHAQFEHLLAGGMLVEDSVAQQMRVRTRPENSWRHDGLHA